MRYQRVVVQLLALIVAQLAGVIYYLAGGWTPLSVVTGAIGTAVWIGHVLFELRD